MKKSVLGVAIAGALSVSASVNAESFRQHSAHVHGQVEINVAQDGNDLLVEIIAPGADVVGFEHAPKSDEQKHKLEDALAHLQHGDEVMTFASAAQCSFVSAEVSHTLGGDEHDDHAHDNHDHDEHAHDEHHDHDHDKHAHDEHHDHDHNHDDHAHDDHDDHHDHHDHHDHDHGEGGHGEFNVQYQFSCDNPEQLNQIATTWFDEFKGTEAVTLNVLTDNVQTSTPLKAGAATFSF